MKLIQRLYFAISILTLCRPVNAVTAAPASTVVNTIPEGIRVFPNPWRADKDGNSTVTFDHLSPASTVKIFTLSGHEVRMLSTDNGSVEWDRTNNAGEKIASGIYLYVVTDGQGNQTKGKLAIIK